MADGTTGPVIQQQAVAIELAIRWIPQTGQLQVVGSQVDDVTKLGMLEMAKVAILAQSQSRQTAPLIVPARFAS